MPVLSPDRLLNTPTSRVLIQLSFTTALNSLPALTELSPNTISIIIQFVETVLPIFTMHEIF